MRGPEGGTDGVFRVSAGRSTIIVYDNDPKACTEIKGRYSGVCEDHPIPVEQVSEARNFNAWLNRVPVRRDVAKGQMARS